MDNNKTPRKKPVEAEQTPLIFTMNKKQQNQHAGHVFLGKTDATQDAQAVPLWLITFTDIMALMLTFFVLLYSMSVPEIDKWEEMTEAVNEGLSRTQTLERFSDQSDQISIEKISAQRALDLGYLATLITEHMKQYEDLESIVLMQSKDELVVSLPADLLFESGNAEASIAGKRALYVLGGILNKIRNRIEVIGHADPRPLSGKGQYGSNWELSLARAATVSSLLKEVGYQRDMIIRGLSSSRYGEISGEMEEEIHMDMARRVDIVIMKDDGNVKTFLDFDS
jgi:chemotaxis protein MotB